MTGLSKFHFTKVVLTDKHFCICTEKLKNIYISYNIRYMLQACECEEAAVVCEWGSD